MIISMSFELAVEDTYNSACYSKHNRDHVHTHELLHRAGLQISLPTPSRHTSLRGHSPMA